MRTSSMHVLLAIAVMAPAYAGAQQAPHREGSWEWNLSAGASLMDPFLREFLASGPPETWFADGSKHLRLDPVLEARVGYNFTRNLGLSVSLADAMRGGVSQVTLGEAFTYTFDLNETTSPFLLLGTELTRIMGDNNRVTHTTWGASAGLGIRHMLSDNLAVRLEGRVQVAGFREVPMRIATTYTPLGLIGLSYFVGGRAPVEPMAMPAARPRVDTVRVAMPVRVDTVKVYRPDTTTRRVRVDTVKVMQVDEADQVVLRVQFRTNRTELLPISYSVLNTVANAIKATPNSKWKVEGHTDSVGKAAANKVLSTGRAQTVVDYLVKQGVDRSILSAEGYGSARQVFSNTTAEGRAQNRRVQLRRIPLEPTVKVP